MPDIKLIISAEDKTQGAFSAVQASAKSAFANIGDSGKSAFSGLSNAAESAGSKIGSVFKSIQANWLAIAGIAGSLMFLKNMAASAYEAEIAFNRLKIQIEGMGIAYSSVSPQVESAIQATAKYAIVQEEEVAGVLQRLIFHSGDLDESMKRLNLTFDVAAQKSIDVSSAADLIGKAMTGNVEMLGRYLPGLKSLLELMGANASEAAKTAVAFAFLEERSAGGLAQMLEQEKLVKEGVKVWKDLGQAIGDVTIKMVAYIGTDLKGYLQGWKALVQDIGSVLSKPFSAVAGVIKSYSDTVGGAINTVLGYTKTVETETSAVKENETAHKKTAMELTLEEKARLDIIAATNKQIDSLKKYADAVKSIGADALKFAEADFALKMKLPETEISEMRKAIADTEKMLTESAKLLSIEDVMENNSAAVQRHYELQKTYITETNTYREKERNSIAELRTAMDDYGSAIDAVYSSQIAKQTSIKTQLEQQKALLESQKAEPKDISAAAEAIASQSVLILESEKKQAEARLGLWQNYYSAVSSLHSQAIEQQKQKTLELLVLETQIANQRQGFAVMETSLLEKAWGAQATSEVEKYYNKQKQMDIEYQAALQLGGQQKIDALVKYQQQASAAAKSVVDDGREYISLQTSAITALDQVRSAQASIVEEQNKLTQAKQDEITKTQEAAAVTKTAMLEAQSMIAQYKAQITDLASQMSALKITIDNNGALAAIAEVKAQITDLGIQANAIKLSVDTSGAVQGKGTEIKPIITAQELSIDTSGALAAIAEVETQITSLGNLIPSVTADFSSLTRDTDFAAKEITALSDIRPVITADFSAVYAGIAQVQAMLTAPSWSWQGLQFQDLSFPDLDFSRVRSYAAGTPYVPHDMIAQIHRGEAIVPAQYNTRGTRDNGRETRDTSLAPRPSSVVINIGDIKITASGTDTPADLAKKLVKPIKEELRRLAQLQ